MKRIIQLAAFSLVLVGTQAFAGACLTAGGKPALFKLNASTDTDPFVAGTDTTIHIGKPAAGSVSTVTTCSSCTSTNHHCGYNFTNGAADTDFQTNGSTVFLNNTFSMFIATDDSKSARIPIAHFQYGTSSTDSPKPGTKWGTIGTLDSDYNCWETDADGVTTSYYKKACLYL